MARPALTSDQVDTFRHQATEVAMRLFAEAGFEGFSLRTLARELGCSHATPYRYFEGKAEIFASARAESFRHFAAFLRTHLAEERPEATAAERAHARLYTLARSYFDFALQQPIAFRLAFEMSGPSGDAGSGHRYAFVEQAAFDAWSVLLDVVAEAVGAGVVEGHVETLAHTMWAGVHGVATLELAGRLDFGMRGRDLLERMTAGLIDAHAPRSRSKSSTRNGGARARKGKRNAERH